MSYILLVRMEGLEPPCLAALDPKSSASTNFATSAMIYSNDRATNKQLVSENLRLQRFRESLQSGFHPGQGWKMDCKGND